MEAKKPQLEFRKSDSQMNQNQQQTFFIDDDFVPNVKSTPYVSCKSYVIIDAKKGKILHRKNENEVREMASLTKMMTAVCTIELARELNLDLKKTYFYVSKQAMQTTGTTAYVVED